MSNLAAYLRYFGVLFLGNGHLRAQVPSKVSVSSAVRKMIKAFSAGLPMNAKISKMIDKINLDNVNKSAKYLINNIISFGTTK